MDMEENTVSEDLKEAVMNAPIESELEEFSTPVEPDEPYESVGLFKIDENMPDDLKRQLEKFNRQTANMNEILSNPISIDEDTDDEESSEDTEILEESSEDDAMIEEEEISVDEIGDLF